MKQFKPTANWNTVWAGISRPHEEMQNHLKCKEQINFCHLPNQGIPKAAPGQRHTGKDAPRNAVHAGWWPNLPFWIPEGVIYHCALVFPTPRLESQACLIGCLWVYHRSVLSRHRYSSCPTHKAKEQLVWYMRFWHPSCKFLSVFRILLLSSIIFPQILKLRLKRRVQLDVPRVCCDSML